MNGHAFGGEASIWSQIDINQNNATALNTLPAPPWVILPDFRGSMDIIQSCVVTLIACVYTAIHTNVPQKTGWKSEAVLKTKWVLYALFAPELVLYFAASQFLRALKLRNELRALRTEQGGDDSDFVIDMKYAFFIIMGGIRVPPEKLLKHISAHDADLRHRKFLRRLLDGKQGIVNLAAGGVLYLARRKMWLRIPRVQIEDRSKANFFQKILVLIQVFWMLLQCVVRVAQGLPITLLEVHTMIHVGCACGLYFFWFEKPLDVHEAELVFKEEWERELALMTQQTFYTEQNSKVMVWPSDLEQCTDRPQRCIEIGKVPLPTFPISLNAGEALSIGIGCATPDFIKKQKEKKKKKAKEEKTQKKKWGEGESKKKKKKDNIVKPIFVDEVVLERFRGVMRSIQDTDASFTEPKLLTHYTGSMWPCFSRPKFMTLSTDDMPSTENSPRIGYKLAIPSMAYGGAHLAALNYQFPTQIEKEIWKTCCIVITNSPTVMVAGLGVEIIVSVILWFSLNGVRGLAMLVDFAQRRRKPAAEETGDGTSVRSGDRAFLDSEPIRTRAGMSGSEAGIELESLPLRRKTLLGVPIDEIEESWGGSINISDWFDSRSRLFRTTAAATFIMIGTAYCLICLGYAAARVFLLVESFISLRNNPIGVYYSPDWLQIMPHV